MVVYVDERRRIRPDRLYARVGYIINWLTNAPTCAKLQVVRKSFFPIYDVIQAYDSTIEKELPICDVL